MNDSAIAIASSTKRAATKAPTNVEWAPGPDRIIIGKDVLELLSTSMYVDPMTIYREYVQNAADAVDEARSSNLIASKDCGRVDIILDPAARSIKIRDNGTGVAWEQFLTRMCSLGASAKRGTPARGFRGVGRLAGLAYCQELIFRSRSEGESVVSELRWDCRRLKSALRLQDFAGELGDLVHQLVSTRRIPPGDHPRRFFEVELNGVIRHRNDRLLNTHAVTEYLSQVAPIPFAPEFQYAADISVALAPYIALGNLEIRLNGSERPIYRPHQNQIELGDGGCDKYAELELHEIPNIDGGVAAVAWILHHSYSGAIPTQALVKGLRMRSGNIQVGDVALLEDLFPEPRFNSWSVGEIHVVDKRLMPNGRRDHFEQNVHFDNLLNHLAPLARDITKRCRHSSLIRKWLREFEVQRASALERAQTVARGGIARAARKAHADAVAKALAAMGKIAVQRQLSDETRAALSSQLKSTATRVEKLLDGKQQPSDPLAHFKPQVRTAYEDVIGLIYDCASNRVAAKALVEKILSKLEAKSAAASPKPKARPASSRTGSKKAKPARRRA